MMLDRDDVERITENILSRLRIVVKDTGMKDTRKISLYHEDRLLSEDYIDVSDSKYNSDM